MEDALVSSPNEVIVNIEKYNADLKSSDLLRAGMTKVKGWYVHEIKPGVYRFGASKVVGYREADAETYAQRRNFRDGGVTEKILGQWFDVVTETDPRYSALYSALSVFLFEYGHNRPNASARINMLKPGLRSPDFRDSRHGARERSSLVDRIAVDMTICGGRPHIRGTRVRVSDVLGMLAEKVPEEEILSDFPYLVQDDLLAALAYGAAAADHLVIEAA